MQARAPPVAHSVLLGAFAACLLLVTCGGEATPGPAPDRRVQWQVAHSPGLVLVGGEQRRGPVLSAGASLVAPLDARPGDALAFSWGVLEDAAPGGSLALAFDDAFDDASGEPTHLVRLDAVGCWTTARVPIPAGASRVIVWLDGDAPAVCVAEARLAGGVRDDRPSVLLITSDTHRADHVGVSGEGVRVATPQLDALAARGLWFEDCFSTANLTNPSHMALMTGLHPRDHGVVSNTLPLVDEARTLAEAFAERGWRTWAATSAIQLGPAPSGLGQGFERVSATDATSRAAAHTVAVVQRWMDEHDGGPVFLWLHVFDAHTPYVLPDGAPPPDHDLPPDAPGEPTLPSGALDHVLPPGRDVPRSREHARARYRSLVGYLDAQLEPVFAWPPFRDGVTVFVADHGESLGEHGIDFRHQHLYPQSVRVPLIVAWPGAPAGRRVSRPVSSVDVGRTLLDLAGLEDADLPGRSLADRLDDAGLAEPRYLLASHGTFAGVEHDGQLAILALRDNLVGIERHRLELYDLRDDPGCTRDLVDARPELARSMRERILRWLAAAEARYWAGPYREDPKLSRALEELGYLGENGDPVGVPDFFSQDDCGWCERFR